MFRSFCAAAVAVALLACGPAAAGVYLDQASVAEAGAVASNTASAGVNDPATLQTFTVGLGGRFDHIDLVMTNYQATNPFRFQLLDGMGVERFARNVAASEVAPSDDGMDLADALHIDLFASDIRANVGDIFTMRLTLVGDEPYYTVPTWLQRWGNDAKASYASGAAYFELPGGTKIELIDDVAFRTYMAVPEPHQWALLFVGFSVAGGMLRVRRAIGVVA